VVKGVFHHRRSAAMRAEKCEAFRECANSSYVRISGLPPDRMYVTESLQR